MRLTAVGRVWILTSALALAALSLTWVVGAFPALDSPFHVPWPLLIPVVYLAEVTVVHLQFRKDAFSFSMNEIPLVVGLFFVNPIGLIGAQLIGNTLALGLHRRQTPMKLSFNLSQFTLLAALSVIVFRSILGDRDPQGTAAWVGILVALALAFIVGSLFVSAAIHLSGGKVGRTERLNVMKLGVVAALMNASLGLVAVTVMWTQSAAAWAAAVPPIVLYLSYRAYINQVQERQRVLALYEATRALNASTEIKSSMIAAVTHAQSMFTAERAEMVIFPAGFGGDGYRSSVGPDEQDGAVEEVGDGITGEVWNETLDSGESRLVPRDAGSRRLLRRETYDTMVVPVRGSAGTNGALIVSDMLGDVRTFTARDLRFLETLAGQVSAALENGRLEDSLAHVTRLKEDMRHRATHDALTGLANRVLLRDKLAEAVDAAEAGAAPAAVVLLDLDDFKAVNDTFGHPAGDQLLASVARRLLLCCRPHDTVARLGGDEFAILLEHLSESEDAITVVRRIISSLAQPYSLARQQVTTHASIGIEYVQPGKSPTDLMRHADEAMYSAKRHGKGTYRVFEAGSTDRVERTPTPSSDLGKAIERGELIIHYQPSVELDTGHIVGLEALVRWDHPRRGLIPPSEFIQLAEETGLIVPLDRFVLGEACQQMSLWHAQCAGHKPSISVNLSARELAEPDIVDAIRSALEDSGLDPRYLTLEITESMIVDPYPDIIAELKELGVGIALDDFGMGYSSLGYLDRLPIDIIKIDRSFVEHVAGDDRSPLARIVLEIGDALGLQTVAEGIETIEQLACLRELGCRFGQGFLFARPMEAIEIEAMLNAQSEAGAGILHLSPTAPRRNP
jgi:diguanylate cyclase (GGDEF)-like protein